MAWYSLLPPHLTTFETWIVRFFILLGILTIGPWAFLVLFDIVLYIWRLATYEIPIVGGRARGRRRPRAPTLTERPSGRRRAFSLRGEETEAEADDRPPEGLKKRQGQRSQSEQ
ncbi:hypothetical protein VTN77DRAFT_1859 [Rasamsonia byssochlamydoides]|uniref:uncharacterized protein n=1 Tax=Rasamsonia byssochlamydoides TaxID=89139 RepID=UPI00374206E2